MEIIRVPDILVYRGGSLHSLRGQQIVNGGELHTFGNGSGMVKDGKLYVLDGEDYVVRMETGKRSVTLGFKVKDYFTVDWGDGTKYTSLIGDNGISHDYTDDITTHTILLKGSAEAVLSFRCPNIELTILEIAICPELSELQCPDNRLRSLDVSRNVNLNLFTCGYNPELASLNCIDIPADQIEIVNSLPNRTGQNAGNIFLSKIDPGVQDICDAKNWEVNLKT